MDIAYLDTEAERDVPHRVVNPELVSYPREETVIRNGKKVVERSRVEFIVCTAERIER